MYLEVHWPEATVPVAKKYKIQLSNLYTAENFAAVKYITERMLIRKK